MPIDETQRFNNNTYFVFQYQDKGSVPECVKRSKDMANIMDMVSMDTLVIGQENIIWFIGP